MTMLTRSYDDGLTWEKPEIIREHGVNTAGGLLKNGIASRMYGRPEQFITFCSDGEGKKWGNDIAIVQGMGDPAIEQNRNTCANSCTYVVGPDTFIGIYSDPYANQMTDSDFSFIVLPSPDIIKLFA